MKINWCSRMFCELVLNWLDISYFPIGVAFEHEIDDNNYNWQVFSDNWLHQSLESAGSWLQFDWETDSAFSRTNVRWNYTELVLSEYCSINYTQPELMKHEAWNYKVWWSASCAKMPLTEMKTGHCWLFLLESSRGKGGKTTYCPLSLLIRSPLGSTWKTTWKNISWNVFGIQQVLFKNILSIFVLHIFWPHAVASSPYGGTLGHRHQETLCCPPERLESTFDECCWLALLWKD